MSSAVIRFAVEAGVATLTLDQPGRRNPLDEATKAGLADAIAEVQRRPDIRALILTGAGGVFCAGGDLRAMQGSELSVSGRRERMAELHRDVIAPLIRLDRPVIAAVDGAAYGGGFSLAIAADFIVATPRARFCMSFLRVGLVPDCGAWYTLPRYVGAQRAKELMLSAREVAAEEALRLGIVMELQPADALLPRARAIAESLKGASPTAVAAVKRGIDHATGGDLQQILAHEADAQALAFSTTEHRDAVAAFMTKQPAAFQWPIDSQEKTS